jgi:NDP-sugar pyrophosphorylase family protein
MHFLMAQLFFDIEDFPHSALWEEGKPVWSALHQLNIYLNTIPLGKVQSPIPQGVFLINPELISIGRETIIEPGVLIQGPCVIGDRCIIRHGAYLRENVILGNQCQVGHSAELKHSILLDGAAATHFVYVGDSIVGRDANLGAGVKCANLRLDRDEVTVHWENQRVKSGLKKFGSIIGDRVQIGCNSVLNPGTLVGKGSLCHPLLNIGGYIPPNSLIKAGHKLQMGSIHV